VSASAFDAKTCIRISNDIAVIATCLKIDPTMPAEDEAERVNRDTAVFYLRRAQKLMKTLAEWKAGKEGMK